MLLLRGLVEPRAFAELRALVELRVARAGVAERAAPGSARRRANLHGSRASVRKPRSSAAAHKSRPACPREVHGRIPVEDLDPADVHRVDRRLVRDRADDVAGLHAVLVAHRNSIADAAARRAGAAARSGRAGRLSSAAHRAVVLRCGRARWPSLACARDSRRGRKSRGGGRASRVGRSRAAARSSRPRARAAAARHSGPLTPRALVALGAALRLRRRGGSSGRSFCARYASAAAISRGSLPCSSS